MSSVESSEFGKGIMLCSACVAAIEGVNNTPSNADLNTEDRFATAGVNLVDDGTKCEHVFNEDN